MIDIEQQLRELGEQVEPAAATPALPSPRTLKRIKVRQRAVSLFSVGATAIVVGSFLMWGPSFHLSIDGGADDSGVNSGGPGRGPSTTLPPGWVVHGGSSGVSIAAPKRWSFHGGKSTVSRPTIDFELGTWRFPSGGACAPTKALKAIPKRGMLLYMLEYSPLEKPPGAFPSRPARFRIEPLQVMYECLGVNVHTISFRAHHRYFQIRIRFGSQADASLRRKVVRSLNTIRVSRR